MGNSSITNTFSNTLNHAINQTKGDDKVAAGVSKEALAADILSLKISAQEGLIGSLESYEDIIQGQLELINSGLNLDTDSADSDWNFTIFTSNEANYAAGADSSDSATLNYNQNTVLDNLGSQTDYKIRISSNPEDVPMPDFSKANRPQGQDGFNDPIPLSESRGYHGKWEGNHSASFYMRDQFWEPNKEYLEGLGVPPPPAHPPATSGNGNKGHHWNNDGLGYSSNPADWHNEDGSVNTDSNGIAGWHGAMKDWTENTLMPALNAEKASMDVDKQIFGESNSSSAKSVLEGELSLVRGQIKAAKQELNNIEAMTVEDLLAEADFKDLDEQGLYETYNGMEKDIRENSEKRTNAMLEIAEEAERLSGDYAQGENFNSAVGSISSAASEAAYNEADAQYAYLSSQIEKAENKNSDLIAQISTAEQNLTAKQGLLSAALADISVDSSELSAKLAELEDKQAVIAEQQAILDDPSATKAQKQQARYSLGQAATEISSISADIASLNSTINSNNSEVNSLLADIQSSSSTIASLNSQVSANTSLISEFSAALESVDYVAPSSSSSSSSSANTQGFADTSAERLASNFVDGSTLDLGKWLLSGLNF